MSNGEKNSVGLPIDENDTGSVAFGIYLLMFIASVCCSLFIYSQFIVQRGWRTKIDNQIIIVVLICTFLQVIIELPLVLIYFRTGLVWFSSDLFCSIWCLIDYSFNAIILLLISYASIQRYLFVFHQTFVIRHRLLLHHFPIVFCLIYPFVFYSVFIFLYPCVHQYDYTKITCHVPCYLFERLPGSLDLLINLTLPLIICIVSNIILLSCVIHQKRQMKQQNKWKTNRTLLLQLLSIVIVHNLVWLPIVVCLLINLFSPVVQPLLIDLIDNLFTYSIYVVVMVCPFISLFFLSDLRQEWIMQCFLFNLFHRHARPTTPQPAIQMGEQILVTLSKLDPQQRLQKLTRVQPTTCIEPRPLP